MSICIWRQQPITGGSRPIPHLDAVAHHPCSSIIFWTCYPFRSPPLCHKDGPAHLWPKPVPCAFQHGLVPHVCHLVDM